MGRITGCKTAATVQTGHEGLLHDAGDDLKK